ncbi:MAG: S-methyl-5-thioribose-1-phosphate isomerase [Betaproteobacteria bacterium]|nr:S-methyl-5-thioribose-1-phosphate isomerase [Betaproteobacteria bacterium]
MSQHSALSTQHSRVETLRWRGGRLELIDQRLLPGRVEYLACSSAAEVARAIREMAIRGAPAIGCAAACGVALEAARLQRAPPSEFAAGLDQAFAALAASRPTAVNLFWALERMRAALQAVEPAEPAAMAARLLDEAHRILAEDVAANRAMGANGAALLEDGMRVLTHCNAGALATAGHGTALGVIRSAVAAGKQLSVVVDETRPFLQGARLTAWELAQDGIPVTLITDGMSGHLMGRGEIDAVVVGADRVAANGDVANKIGTYMIAVLARRHGIPFYVAAPLSTIDPRLASGDAIPIEEREASEVRGYGGVEWAPAGVAVRNPVFDVTPADLVTALITEKGVVPAPDRGKIAALLR